MKTFPAAFTTEKNRLDGAHPLWILRLTVAAVDYWLCDSALAIPAFTGSTPWPAATVINTLAWVKKWGTIREGISGALGEFHVADFSLEGMIIQGVTPNIETLVTAVTLTQNPVELYEWFLGCTDPPQRIFKGRVGSPDNLTDSGVGISFQDDSILLEKTFIGTRITSEVYPLADPDTVGQVIPIVYGFVPQLPALCVDSGWVTSIPAAVDAIQTSVVVSEVPANSIVGKIISIDDEQMLITAGGTVPGRQNYAAASKGGVVSANWYFDYVASRLNDGNRINQPGWMVSNFAAFEDVTVALAVVTVIDEINVFFVQGGTAVDPTTPGLTDASVATHVSVYGSADNGATWTILADITGNSYIWINRIFAPISVNKLLYRFYRDAGFFTTCAEVEAWGVLSTKTLTVTRGWAATTMLEHTKGSTVVEKKATPLIYLCADHALDAIGPVLARVRGVRVDITSDCTKYLGSAGNQLAAYPGKAAISIPDFAKVAQRVSIAVANSLAVAQGSHTHATTLNTVIINFDQAYSQTGTGWTDGASWPDHQMVKAIDGNSTTYAATGSYGGRAWINRVAAASGAGTPISARLRFDMVAPYGGSAEGSAAYVIYVGDVIVLQGDFPVMTRGLFYSNSFTLTAWTQLLAANGFRVQVSFFMGGSMGQIYEVVLEVTTGTPIPNSPATGVSLLGTLGLSGNSVADIMIGDALLVDCTCNMNTPAAVFSNLLTTWCNLPAVTQQGTFPVSYIINGAITEYDSALKILNRLAFQLRAWFVVSNGLTRLIVRGAAASVKTIPACIISEDGRRQLTRNMTAVSDVLQRITVLYDRDWTQSGSATAYKKSYLVPGGTGTDERPELFQFDFVTGAVMAADVGAFYLAQHKDRHWQAEFPATLQHSELEFGDPVTLGFLAGLAATVISAEHAPGSSDQADRIKLTALY